MKKIRLIPMILLIAGSLAGCQKSNLNAPSTSGETFFDALRINPAEFVVPENFVEGVSNPFFPLNPGDTLFYELTAIEGGETIIEESYIAVTSDIKIIAGVQCMVIRDLVTIDGVISEDTYDWYAQDIYGNVWYLGEDTKKYAEDGSYSTLGSFEHGVDGAVGGLFMLADPASHIGYQYQQENYPGFAEDRAKIIATDQTVTIGLGTYSGCLQTAEGSTLSPGILGYKYYAPGIGQIFSTTAIGGVEDQELTGTNF